MKGYRLVGHEVISSNNEKSLILSGDILFFTANDLVGKAITEITSGDYCHVAVAFADSTGRLMVLECQGGTPKRVVDLSFYEGRTVAIVGTVKAWGTLRDKAVQGLGAAGYDYIEAGLAGFGALVARETNWRLETHASGHICSTFIAQLFGVTDEVIAPAELFELLLS